jgi:hypothetical protein
VGHNLQRPQVREPRPDLVLPNFHASKNDFRVSLLDQLLPRPSFNHAHNICPILLDNRHVQRAIQASCAMVRQLVCTSERVVLWGASVLDDVLHRLRHHARSLVHGRQDSYHCYRHANTDEYCVHHLYVESSASNESHMVI